MAAKNTKHINLIPQEDFERTTLGRIMKWALTSFRFIVIVVEFIVISGFLFRFWLDVQISDLDDEITQKSALISSKSSFEKDFRKVQKKVSIIKEVTAKENLSFPVMQEVVGSLPPDAQIISLVKEADVVDILGATVSESSIATFMANLKAKNAFSEVSLQEITTNEDSPLIEFRIGLRIDSLI